MLSQSKVKDFYDRFGAKQDWQGFYENPAIKTLVRHGEFATARSVFEFGCGTGKFARHLLENHLPENCRYIGTDLSETMIELAKNKLKPFADRAKVRLSDGSAKLSFPDESFDRFISNYVLDILSEVQIGQIITEADRVLQAKGRLCLISLTCGENFISRKVSAVWQSVYQLSPLLVGGCRPLNLVAFIKEETWKVSHHSKISRLGITSEVLIAEKRPGR